MRERLYPGRDSSDLHPYVDGFYADGGLRQQAKELFGPRSKSKSGRGSPTTPTLRPRVLTPRDHFVHRGGGRSGIMQ